MDQEYRRRQKTCVLNSQLSILVFFSYSHEEPSIGKKGSLGVHANKVALNRYQINHFPSPTISFCLHMFLPGMSPNRLDTGSSKMSSMIPLHIFDAEDCRLSKLPPFSAVANNSR